MIINKFHLDKLVSFTRKLIMMTGENILKMILGKSGSIPSRVKAKTLGMSIVTTLEIQKIYSQLKDRVIICREAAFVKIVEQKYTHFMFPLPLINYSIFQNSSTSIIKYS